MKVKVCFFAACREIVGKSEMELELQEGEPISSLIETLQSDYHYFLTMPIKVAVNTEYVEHDYRLQDGDEVALIPPISGG
jgi:molybdopterin synthase sulfur carrier subunit